MKFECAHCGKAAERPAGHVNRSRRLGLRLFCGRRCSGLGRRDPNPPTKDERVAAKRAYDAAYRRKNRALLKAKKAAYFRRTYDPAKAAIERKARMPRHVEYCRRPEYKAYKRQYDRQHRAREYGPFAEAFMLCIDLNREIKRRMTDYEIRTQNGTLNKIQARRREALQQERSRRDRAA